MRRRLSSRTGFRCTWNTSSKAMKKIEQNRKVLVEEISITKKGERVFFQVQIPDNACRVTNVKFSTDAGEAELKDATGSFSEGFSDGFDT